MKSKKRSIRGPRIQYFRYGVGVVNAKTSRLKVGAASVMSITLLATSIYGGLHMYRVNQVALRENQQSQHEQKPEQSQTEQRESAKKAYEDEGLAKIINKKVKEMPRGTKWSVSVRDLKTERMANVNADDMREAASLYKLFLFAPLDAKLSAKDWKGHVKGKSIESCAELMLKISDNDCAVALGNYASWKSIDTVNHSYGFKKTQLNSAESQKTTAREVSELMYRLQNSQMLSDKARRIFFDGLYRQKLREGIPTGCGPLCLVGNKTGELNNVRHDAAVVTHGEAKYIIVIMSEGGTWQQIADIARVVDQAMLP